MSIKRKINWIEIWGWKLNKWDDQLQRFICSDTHAKTANVYKLLSPRSLICSNLHAKTFPSGAALGKFVSVAVCFPTTVHFCFFSHFLFVALYIYFFCCPQFHATPSGDISSVTFTPGVWCYVSRTIPYCYKLPLNKGVEKDFHFWMEWREFSEFMVN